MPFTFNKIYLTSFDTDVTYPGGPRWLSRTVRVDQKQSRLRLHWKRGLDTDSCVLVLIPRNVDAVTGEAFPDKIGGIPWLQAAQAGYLDGCEITVYRAYFNNPPPVYAPVVTPVAILTAFTGRIAEVDVSDSMVAVTLNDYRELLSQQLPRDTYQASCRFTLFGFGCGLQRASFAVPGTVQAGSTQATIISSALTPPTPSSGTFLLGQIEFTSGANSGFNRTVRTWATGPDTLGMVNPFPFSVAPGDTFNIYPGCNKTQGACTAFANRLNYGGQDYIPDASTSV